MSRFMSLLFCALTGIVLALPASADDPPKKLTPEEREELFAKWDKLKDAGLDAYRKDNPAAARAFREALEVARVLYPKTDFPDGHRNLALSLNNLAAVYEAQGKYAEAEPLYKDALKMYRRLFEGDHLVVVNSLNNLAYLYQSQGKYGEAEPLYKDALDMLQRLFKGDHFSVATNLNNLAVVYKSQGKYAKAEPLFKDALDMLQRLFKAIIPLWPTA